MNKKIGIFLLFFLFAGQLWANSDSPVVSQHANGGDFAAFSN